jgi:hypothetical protein
VHVGMHVLPQRHTAVITSTRTMTHRSPATKLSGEQAGRARPRTAWSASGHTALDGSSCWAILRPPVISSPTKLVQHQSAHNRCIDVRWWPYAVQKLLKDKECNITRGLHASNHQQDRTGNTANSSASETAHKNQLRVAPGCMEPRI